MRRIRSALGSGLIALVAGTAASLAPAPSNGAAQDISPAVAGGRTTLRTLAPSEIITQARRAGFEPISRPVQRGPVYVLFAVDGDDNVKLTVAAHSGRLLWVADIGSTRYGGYYGYPAWPLRVRPPVPPVDIPNAGPDRNNFRPDRIATSARRSPPLPRTRPGELTSAVESATPAQAAAPVPADVAPAAKPPPTMVPVAPLE